MAVAVLLSVACSGHGGESSRPDEAALSRHAGVVGQAFDPDRDGPAASIEGVVGGGTVTVMLGDDVATLDPTEAYYFNELTLLSDLVTRSLTQYVYDPAGKSMVLVPDLATDLGTPNADFTEWTFTIRDGVRFEDGSKVTAQDMAYGIERSLDKTTFPDGPRYSNDYFLDDDGYKGVYTSGTEYAGVRVDGNTLTLEMQRPFPDMPYWGAYPAMGPIPELGSAPATYAQHPLATGPYRFADYIPGKSLTLVRNDEWDPNTDPGRHAYPDGYKILFNTGVTEIGATVLGDSEQGQTTLSPAKVPPQDYRRAQRLGRLTVGSGSCTNMWYPDYRKIPEIGVRRAIGYALDFDDVARMFGDLEETSVPGASILPPGFPGRQSYNVLETDPGHADPGKAKALLKQAGWAPGEYELRFPYPRDTYAPVEHIVKSLEAAGFQATPRLYPTWQDVFEVNADPDAPVNLRPGGWCPDWPSGGNWFPALFHSATSKSGVHGAGEDNWAHFVEPEIDAEINRIRQLPFEEQPTAWGALDKTMMTDYYPAIITSYPGVEMLHGSHIGGMSVDNVHSTPTWKDIHVIP